MRSDAQLGYAPVTEKRDATPGSDYDPRRVFGMGPQLRMLVTDGPMLLAFVGVYFHPGQKKSFNKADKVRLESLVEPMQRRLRLDLLAGGPLGNAMMHATLEAIAVPAFVLSSGLTIQLANSSGLAWLDGQKRSAVELFREAVRRGQGPFGVTIIQAPGVPDYWLLVLYDQEQHFKYQVTQAARRWGLTARQTEVLRRLACGEANKAIAAGLGIETRTAEIHVTAILRRAQFSSRSELIAHLLRG